MDHIIIIFSDLNEVNAVEIILSDEDSVKGWYRDQLAFKVCVTLVKSIAIMLVIVVLKYRNLHGILVYVVSNFLIVGKFIYWKSVLYVLYSFSDSEVSTHLAV